MAGNTNPLADAFGGGLGRRRQPGEAAGSGSGPTNTASLARTAERRVAVDIRSGLYTEVKVLAAQTGMTVKQISVAGLRAELERLREPTE